MARRKRGRRIDGWLLVDKPEGVTSTQVVGRARWAFDAQKAGHAGTLDPLATGLLAVAFGEATKTVPYAQDGLKTYRFTVRWGELSATDDREGEIIERSAIRPDNAAIEAVLPDFVGTIMQRPPAFSAIKVGGARAYDLARDGAPPELAERPILIRQLRLIDRPDVDHAVLEMTCGKGGYVRSVARDLGAALGTVARVDELRRVASGGFAVDAALSFAALEALRDDPAGGDYLLPVQAGLSDLPRIAVDDSVAGQLRHGQGAAAPRCDAPVYWLSCRDQPVAIMASEGGLPVIRRIFSEPAE
ncbi:MAG: tRNA pseudouridine(55) synthase TruB [Pseudomonadota bacterium]